ncbi:DUF2293 domain-containing protein [Labilibacter sediminis]|nr:DUF2293 domain-containing protein [Labilibacter sediminis]
MLIKKQDLTIGPAGKLLDEYGKQHSPPCDWDFLPAGDAGITRKVTAKGIYWRIIFKKGRRTMSKGIWAPASTIAQAKQDVHVNRSTDEYKKQREYTIKRREKQQKDYEAEFCLAIENFLGFHQKYNIIAKTVAILVTKHAIPVGSGTVARTAMIPIEQRAAKAVIAWMRHQTTAYDNMQIAHVKGERRAVRRMLAEQSVIVLENYRKGKVLNMNCPLKKALETLTQ